MNLLRKFAYRTLAGGRATYNACWEDPRIDRSWLDIRPDSRMVVITSGGCNALDYLLDNPAVIHAVDVNPAQNALLELKKALFKHGCYPLLRRFFGEGKLDHPENEYRRKLRKRLPEYARRYWDSYIGDFNPGAGKRSFYDTGGAGAISRWVQRYVTYRNLDSRIGDMIAAPEMMRQQSHYKALKNTFWSPLARWILNTEILLELAGVSRRQKKRILRRYGGIHEYLSDKLDRVFTRVDLRDNYFWYVYLTGRYEIPSNCPNYLKPCNFQLLRDRHESIRCHNQSVVDFLRESSSSYTHFVLLDHQDWLGEQELREEWRLLLEHADPGARILFRSVLPDGDLLPEFAYDCTTLHSRRTVDLEPVDRVGTYETLNLAVVQ